MLDKHLVISGTAYCRTCNNSYGGVQYRKFDPECFTSLTEEEFYEEIDKDYFDFEVVILKSTRYAFLTCPKCHNKIPFNYIANITVENDAEAPEMVQQKFQKLKETKA